MTAAEPGRPDSPRAALDPRPVIVSSTAGPVIAGLRCGQCRYPVAVPVAACPACGGAVEADHFGPQGTVAASTCLRIRVPGRVPPYAVAYLDVDDGPRVLVHTAGSEPVPVGTRLRLGPKNPHGDLTGEMLA